MVPLLMGISLKKAAKVVLMVYTGLGAACGEE